MLYLMRHGQAGNDFPDERRTLTSQGEEDARQVCRFLKSKKVQICSVWHSPLVRACQTAGIVASVLNPEHDHQIKNGYLPNDPVQIAVDQIEEFFMKVSNKNLLIVSHLPLLPQIVEMLTGKSIAFPTSNCLALSKDENGRWIACEMIQPTI